MDTRQAVGWLHRRAGFGLHPTEYDRAVEQGFDAELAKMLATSAERSDPWEGVELDPRMGGRREAVEQWVATLAATAQPMHDRRTWMLHGWLVSSLDKVNVPRQMVDQIRLFMAAGGGSFPDLLHSLTRDQAMLRYLDGTTSTGQAPNENYGRELMELFALGVGNYTEDDVQAAATALTGWVASRRSDASKFVSQRHDDNPQTLLAVEGVHDVDTVIDAVTNHPSHPRFVAERIAQEYLGDLADPVRSDVLDELEATYLSADMALDPVINRALQLGVDGATTPIVLAPIPWLVICIRATGVSFQQARRASKGGVRAMGQVPLYPPSVAGWPTGVAWLTSSSLVARTNLAARFAAEIDSSEPVHISATDGDLDLLAEQLGLAESFSAATTAAIKSASDPAGRLAVALVSPENLLS